MLKSVHEAITRRALKLLFSPGAMDVIVDSNVRVDMLWNQLGHDELHFDNNAFSKSRAYIAGQRAAVRTALDSGRPRSAWQAFGRLTHTVQDFYSHSNYVSLWLASRSGGILPPAPVEIDPHDPILTDSPSLRSGKSYLPLGALSFVPGLGKLVASMLPLDSHAHMNLDDSSRGPLFEYAFHAAVLGTRREYEAIALELAGPVLAQFRDLPDLPSLPV